jgi:hypothetical protein
MGSELNMPNLILFAACESVVIAQNNSATLVSLLSEITFGELPAVVPDNAAAPFKWSLITEWEIIPTDAGKTWEQRIRLLNARDEAKFEALTEFVTPNNKIQRTIAGLSFFPIVPGGPYHLELAYRETGQADWIRAHSYPLFVNR